MKRSLIEKGLPFGGMLVLGGTIGFVKTFVGTFSVPLSVAVGLSYMMLVFVVLSIFIGSDLPWIQTGSKRVVFVKLMGLVIVNIVVVWITYMIIHQLPIPNTPLVWCQWGPTFSCTN